MKKRASRDWRRASGSLNSRPLRTALFGAAARSADSFSSVASRLSVRRSKAPSRTPKQKPRPKKFETPYIVPRTDSLERRSQPFDALRLLRRLPVVYAGWVHVRTQRFGLRPWSLYWAELRGGFILLSRDDGPGLSRVHYVFGASNCAVAAAACRNGVVTLRVKRLGKVRGADSLEMRRDSAPARMRTKMIQRRGLLSKGDEEEEHAPMLTMRVPSAPEADKWVWALRNATPAYRAKSQGDFQIVDALGAGAFGRVYLVRDITTSEYLALKVVDKDLVFRDRLHFESAVNERITLEMINGHEFMARLRYAFQTRSCLYLVTDFYEGGDLFSFLRNHHANVTERQAIRIIAEVILALESMHNKGIVYRDLKPENVLLDERGHVRLVDLGLAKVLSRESNYLTTTICGSLSYAAPEMLSEREYGLAFDMWTLGVFVYQVLTGDMPFETEDRSRQEILRDQKKGHIPEEHLSRNTLSLVRALLQPDPAKRPNCREVRRHPMFADIDWDELAMKLPHPDSLEKTMRETADIAAARSASEVNGNDPSSRTGAFLLRNFDPDEWSDMTFSDVSDGQSVSSFFMPNFSERERAPMETRMLAGWAYNANNVVPLNRPHLAVPAKQSMDNIMYEKKRLAKKPTHSRRVNRNIAFREEDQVISSPRYSV